MATPNGDYNSLLEEVAMPDAAALDTRFRDAVAAIDAGDLQALKNQLAAHPDLARQRLITPGPWLRDQVGDALDGFFRDPYLLWFVAEDPVRTGRLPANIAEIARTIIQAARQSAPDTLHEQLDVALRLVCWSWIARQCGVQIDLIDVLVETGASPDGRTVYEGRFGSHSDAAICNGNFDAAEHLVRLGAPLTLSTALCLDRSPDVDSLVGSATLAEKQDAFVLAARGGRAEALRRMLAHGLDPTTVSAQNQSHGTALHHAVWSASLDAVKVLVDAGADTSRRDNIYNGTPLGWARHAFESHDNPAYVKRYAEIAEYLREMDAKNDRNAMGRAIDRPH
jgi:peptide-methionine (S)-S-oxide reductase